jgi:predicted HAD superfamily Cof-like phosphohydrolase
VGTDANGKVLTSLVMVPAEAAGGPAPRRWSKALKNFRRALDEALIHSRETVAPNGTSYRAADREDVREAFYKIFPAEGDNLTQQQDSRRQAFHRAVKNAQDNNLIGIQVDHSNRTLIWLSDAAPIQPRWGDE